MMNKETHFGEVLDPIIVGGECCGNCRFFKAAKCCRGPPTALIIVGQGTDGRPAHVGTIADWPPTRSEAWCGEYKRKVIRQ
jgi:hypothetical protein